MANQFSPAIYSGGAVEFDSTPTVNLANQIMNRQMAKSEALEQHYQNQFKNVNSAGMRTQDIPQFTAKVNEWQQFYQQNKKAIRNPRLDGGKAASEFQARMQDAAALTQQSKNEQKKYEDLVPLLRDPEKRSRIPESFLQGLAAHELPLGDPNRKSLDLSTLNFDAKPFDVTMQQKYLQGAQQGLKMDEQITGVTTDPKSFMQTVTTTSSLGPEAKGAIQSRAAGAYVSDPSFKSFIDEQATNPNMVKQYNEIYKKAYGKDISTPEDLAAAWTLNSIQDNITKQKSEADWKARQDYLQGQRVALLNKRLAAEKSGKSEQDGWINEYVGVLKEQSMGGRPIQYKYKDGRIDEEYDIPMDATLAKMLQRGTGSSAVQPDFLRYNPKTGKFRPLFGEYETVKVKQSDGSISEVSRLKKTPNGKIAVDEELSQPISESQLVLALGGRVTPTQRTIEMKKSLQNNGGDKSEFKINGKSYNRKQLNDMGYDDDEIEQFIKTGVISQ